MSAANRTLLLLALAELLAMSVWFSGTAVLPELLQVWQVGLAQAAWLTLAVQAGFVAGALAAALLNLPDVLAPPRLITLAMVMAALMNLGFVVTAPRSMGLAIFFRMLSGVALAGVYPPAMKILAGWFQEGRGRALGVLIGALGVGSALPHALRALGAVTASNWTYLGLASTVLTLVGAAIVAATVREGPFAAPLQPFDRSQIAHIVRNRPLALANLGYFGHMWELYAWWAWVSVLFLRSADRAGAPWPLATIETVAFTAMAMGGPGCVVAGVAADRSSGEPGHRIRQRALVTIVAMAVSGACCLLTGLLFAHVYAVAAIALVWGLTISADSAQFSAIVSEVSDPRYVGTALTLQTALGFLLTVVSIRVTAAIGERWGWAWAAVSLAAGPALGIVAMLRLRRQPLAT